MTDRTRDEIARILKDNTRSKADRVDELLRMREGRTRPATGGDGKPDG